MLVNLRSGKAIAGVLWRRGPRFLRLRGAELIEGDRRYPVDGEVLIEWANVDFVQVLPGGGS